MNLPGYRATRNPDGSMVVHDVPIFVECKRGELDFNAEWISAAVDRAREAATEGYYPPLHVRHHEGGDNSDVTPAGFFRITGVHAITFKGSSKLAVFADLVITNPGVSYDVLQKRLPYRSVEILDVQTPALDSLALLDHEAPYLELPMLMVSDVRDMAGASQGPVVASATFASPWKSKASREDLPVLAFYRRGNSAHLVTEDPPVKPKTEDSKRRARMAAEDRDRISDDDSNVGGGKKTSAKTEKMDAADGPAPEGGTTVADIIKTIKSGKIAVKDMEAIVAAIREREADKQDDDAPADVDAPGAKMRKQDDDEEVIQLHVDDEGETPTPAKPRKPAAADDDDPVAIELAAIRGENAALRKRLDASDASGKRKDDVAIALQRLKGRPMGAEVEKELVAFHKEHGPKAFAAYVDRIVKTFAQAPDDADAAARFAGGDVLDEDMPECVEPWHGNGAKAVAQAAAFAKEWELLKSKGGLRSTQENYVAINMARAGFKPPRKPKPAVNGKA
jgi:hypothetical protein